MGPSSGNACHLRPSYTTDHQVPSKLNIPANFWSALFFMERSTSPLLSFKLERRRKVFHLYIYYNILIIIFYFYNAPLITFRAFLKSFCDAAKMAIIHKKI
jgi:hypothetical protein